MVTSEAAVTVFGIRHHGPGSARSLRAALERVAPDLVLVEGPSDAQDALTVVAHPDLRPPVALLVYRPDAPRRAAYFPFCIFSPEWQALQYAAEHDVPARFIDLPQGIHLASDAAEPDTTLGTPPLQQEAPAGEEPGEAHAVRQDPFALVARAAGYEDRELWWECQVEQRRDATDLFDAILELMAVLRAEAEPPDALEARREAWMRQALRTARRDGYERIAVVCGAWHAPALTDLGGEDADLRLVERLPQVPTLATWIPWTNSRLSSRSGYGAGIAAPGWYEHLWTAPDRTAIRWVTHVARLLRAEDLDASPAAVIETVRLAEALAALRSLPSPGLAELQEAVLTVLCHGEAARINLIRAQLEVGERLGRVPDETPAVPLQRDLYAQQRRLRLVLSAEATLLDLDLRKGTDRERSQLLHRLLLLNVPWGRPQPVRGKSGTFHELWQLQWQPELSVRLIEAGGWGLTILDAAVAVTRHQVHITTDLPDLTMVLSKAVVAALPGVIGDLLERIATLAAVSGELQHLMQALLPLARAARYGDVRGTPAAQLVRVFDGIFARVAVGLPGACLSLDDDAAAAMVASMNAVQESVGLLDDEARRQEWQAVLRQLSETEHIHGLVRGRCCRLLVEGKVLDSAGLQRQAQVSLAPVVAPQQAAAWIEGLLQGNGMLLLHQDALWRALDNWLCSLEVDVFTAVLPLLRRAFADFQPAERRSMGETVQRLSAGGRDIGIPAGETAARLNHERAALVLPVLARILGVQGGGEQ